MSGETIDSMEVQLVANLTPLFSALEGGLRQVRDKVQGFKEGKVELSATIDKMLGQLGNAKARTASWKRETDSVAVVQPGVNPSAFVSGLQGLKARAEAVARQLGNVFFAAAGFREITNVVGDWVRASNAQEMALARLRAGLANVKTAGTDAYGTLVAQAVGLQRELGLFGDEQIESAQAMLSTFQLNEKQIAALIPRILDMAAATEKSTGQQQDLEQIAIAVGKATAGQTGILARYGVVLDEAAIKADGFTGILTSLDMNFKGMAKSVSETGAGPLRAVARLFDDLKETFGDVVKAVLVPLAAILRPILEGFLALPAPVREAVVIFGVLGLTMKLTSVGLADLVLNLLALIETMGVGAAAAVSRFAVALATLNWQAMTAGISGAASALAGMVNGLNLASMGILIVAAAWAGWKIGRWISDITGLSAATSTAARMDSQWTDAEIERFSAQLQAKSGIDMNVEAMRLWIRLAPEVRRELISQAQATGNLRLSVEDLTAALRKQAQAQRDAALEALWADEKRQLDDYLSYYRRSRAEQIAIDIASVEQQLAAASKGSDEEKKLQQQLSALLRQAAQERVRSEQDAARQSAQAWQEATDKVKAKIAELGKAMSDAAAKATSDWAAASQSMAADMLKASDPEEYEKAQVRIEAADNLRKARATLTGQELADALVRIEQWKVSQLGIINDKYRQDEAEKAQRALEESQQNAERSYQEALSGLTRRVQDSLDPLSAVVRQAYETLNERTAIWAEQTVNVLRPVQQAFYSLLNGMKVKWGDVLRAMLANFLMIFVNKILAILASKVIGMVMGSAAKEDAGQSKAKMAEAKAQEKSAFGVAAANMSAAIAEIFAAHAWIPFAGVGLAIAFSEKALIAWALMTAVAEALSVGFTAMATGGIVDRPTMTLFGEAGPEVFAPAKDFKEVVGTLLADTLATARLAAIGVGQAARADAQAGAGAGVTWEPHLHGMALVDTGNRAYLQASARKINRALWDEARQKLGR
jgi:hypothetical protein